MSGGSIATCRFQTDFNRQTSNSFQSSYFRPWCQSTFLGPRLTKQQSFHAIDGENAMCNTAASRSEVLRNFLLQHNGLKSPLGILPPQPTFPDKLTIPSLGADSAVLSVGYGSPLFFQTLYLRRSRPQYRNGLGRGFRRYGMQCGLESCDALLLRIPAHRQSMMDEPVRRQPCRLTAKCHLPHNVRCKKGEGDKVLNAPF